MTKINNNTSAKRCQQHKKTPLKKQKRTQSTIPDRFIETLKDKLRGTASKTSKYIDIQYTDTGEVKIKKIPITSIRGNAVYSWKRSKAINSMIGKLKKRVVIETGTFGDEYILTNTLFLTCTLRCDVADYKSLEKTWELFQDKSSAFTTALKRIGKKEQRGLVSELQVVEYIQSFEAHLSSACHSHLVLLLKEPILCKKQVIIHNGVEKIQYIPSEDVKNILFSKYENTFGTALTSYDCFNVQGCYAVEGLGGYISKELIKQHGNIEPILRKVDKDLNLKEPLTDGEIKTLYLHYFTHIFKMDMIRTSRGLSCIDNSNKEDVAEKPLDFIEELNNKNEEGYIERGSIILSNKQLYQYMKREEISPYSGFLPDGREKQVVLELIAQSRAQTERIMMMVNEALRL